MTFTPSAVGARNAAVTLTDDALDSPETITLSGQGLLQPTADLSATNLTYSGAGVGSTSASQTVTLTNNGNAPLTITGIVDGWRRQRRLCGFEYVYFSYRCRGALLNQRDIYTNRERRAHGHRYDLGQRSIKSSSDYIAGGRARLLAQPIGGFTHRTGKFSEFAADGDIG